MIALGFAAGLTAATVTVTIGMLVWERFPPHHVLLGATFVLVMGGVLGPAQALAGFSNKAVLTVAVLFLVASALRSSGAIRWVGSFVLGRPRGTLLAQARLFGVSSSLSAFINNMPVVAMLTAAVEDWSRRAGVAPSKLLLPLSYAAILGGLCSIIGTSTNLIVNGLIQGHPGLRPLRMFEPAWVGVPALLAGGAYLLTIGRWLLPDRRSAMEQAEDTREYVLEMRVDAAGPLVGRSVLQAGLRNLSGLFLIEIQRSHEVLPAVMPDVVLQGDDRLVFVGKVDGLRELRQRPGLSHTEEQVFKVASGEGRHFVEAVVSRLSPVVGQNLREARFRDRYGAVVVAVNRRGRRLEKKPGDIVLQPGDTLLLETRPAFIRQFAQSRDFLMVNLLDDTPPVQPRRALTALGILIAMIVANAVFHVDLFISAVLAAAAVIGTGCLGLREAYKAIDFSLVIVIACSLAVGAAIDKTGIAARIAGFLMQWGGSDPFWTMVLLYVLTVVFTELITNNAAAVLMFPIALAVSAQLGVSPMPFILAVMMGASASFITPIGYQTNMMVYGPGGYRFLDYVRVGTPLSLVVGTVVVLVIPHVWPF